ncbi:hypothetical protein SAY87_011248 [Trapa incisa]|uniref:Glutathione peroxidase n=1 Tax=Trapa incisa TaxID=236973 RepID=A0AAN7JBC7_9MYRT|nr:hypothetical protein SAY87_011248 [Trapa incisa]
MNPEVLGFLSPSLLVRGFWSLVTGRKNLSVVLTSVSLLSSVRSCSSSKRAHLLLNRKFPYAASSESSSPTPSWQHKATGPLCCLRSSRTMASQSKSSVHDYVVKDARGNDVDLSTYKGKVLLIVNVASQCGLTDSNYTELAEVYSKYRDQGLEILAFPCNQFGAQEPGTNEQILQFACTRFKAEYPIFGKVDVNGEKAAPLYKFLKSSKGGLLGDDIKWNFSKFLVDKEGNVVNRYAPTTSPLSIEKDIKKLLEKN